MKIARVMKWLVAVAIVLALAQESRVTAASAGSYCIEDSDCGGDSRCIRPRGNVFPPICIPHSDVTDDSDDEECVYHAICSAAAALRRVCPECILNQQDSCFPIPPSDDPEEQKKREHLDDTCLKLTAEQNAALTMPAKFRKAQKDSAETQLPDLNLSINGWSIDGPLYWAGPGESGRLRLERRKALLHQKLRSLPEFRPLCPFMSEENGKLELVAGVCGGFRNPDPGILPPRLSVRPP